MVLKFWAAERVSAMVVLESAAEEPMVVVEALAA